MKNTTIFKRLLGYLKAYRLRLFFVLLSAVISTAFMVLAPFLVGKVTTTLFASIADKVFYWETIIWLLAALAALYFVSQLFSFLQGFGMAKITANVMQTIRREIDEKMHRLKLNYYDVHTHGDILSVITNDVDTINNTISQNLTSIVTQVTTAIGVLIMMLMISPKLSLIPIVMVPLSLLSAAGVMKASEKYYGEQQELLGKLNGYVEEMYNGQSVVQTFNYQERAKKKFSQLNDALKNSSRKAETTAGAISPITTLVNDLGYARDGSMVTNLTPDRINTQEEFKSYYKEVFETIYTLDYLQGKAYLELTPAQQSAITSQHRYGTTNNYQSRNQSNSTWRTIGAAELENMNLKTLDDLWDNQLTIRPGHRFDLRSMNDVGVNNLGAYQIDRVCYASWYVPYVDGGTPNAQTFRRNGYELGGLYGYSDGLVEYLSNRTQTGDLAYFKKKMQDENFSFETYRKNKNKEIEEKIKKQKEQGNAYFDEEALIEYLKQNMINYGNGINSGVSTGNNTLNNIKESRENVFRYLQRITDEFRSPVYADTAESRHAVTISTGQELIEKINENPNGFYVLEKDISMADINLTGEVYIDKTFIGKLQGNGHKITDAQGPLFAKIANSYVSDLTIVNKEGETKDWFGKTKQYTIIVNEQKKETVQEIKTLEELKTVGQNKYTKYVLKNDIDASSVTTETAVVKGIFKGEFDGGGFTIKGLKKPLFEKVQEGTVRNLKIENAEINSTEESSKNAVITKESNHAVFESLNLADIKVSGVSYNAVVTGYDYTSSVFSKIQIRNAQITGTKNYNAVLAGRASGSQIQDVSVIGSSVALSGTDCGGFIGEGKNVTISRVYSDADMTVNTYTDDKNRTQSAGFIGNLTGKSSVEYVFAAGKVDNKTSEQLYNFIGTPDALKTMVKNSFVIQNAGGVSNITDGVGQEILREVTSQEAATSDFYKTSMTLNEETWNLSLVPMKGYPELKGMEKREVISVKTAEDFMKMKDFPTQEYRLKADIDLSGTEQTGSVIPEFSGVLDGENHKITGLKAPLFGQLSGTVSNVAIDAGAIEIGNSVDTTVGIFANTMTNATVEKVMIANGSISSTAGKAAGFAGTVTDSTVKNIFIQGRVNAVSTASGFAETSHHSVMENIYANIDVNGADGAGFLVNSKIICR